MQGKRAQAFFRLHVIAASMMFLLVCVAIIERNAWLGAFVFVGSALLFLHALLRWPTDDENRR